MKYTFCFLIIFVFSSLFSTAQSTTSYWPNGKLKEKGFYAKDSIKTGLWMTWFDNGQLSDSGEFVAVTADNFRLKISESGFPVDTNSIRDSYINKTSIPTGICASYYKNGVLMERGEYLPLTELVIEFQEVINEDGSSTIVYPLPVSLYGLKTGVWKTFNEDGTVMQAEKYDKNGKVIEKK